MICCPQCASDVEDSASVCWHCGAAISAQSGAPAVESLATGNEAPAPFSSSLLDADRHLEGIGGWLILIMLGLVLSPLVILFSTLFTNLPLLTGERFRPFLETHPALQAVLIFEVVTNLIFVAILVALNYLFFTKKRAFPTYMILYLSLQFVVILADMGMVHAVLPATPVSAAGVRNILRAIIGATVWIPYFLASRRVKVTFVH